MASTYEEPVAAASRSAVAKLQFAAQAAGLIGLDEWIEHIPGSRVHDDPPQVNVRGPHGPRPLAIMPEFSRSTRGREVVMAMEAAAATLRALTGAGSLGG